MGKKNLNYFEVEISKNFPSGISTHVDWEPSTNIIEVGNLIIIEVELPGVKKDDISIVLQSFTKKLLSIFPWILIQSNHPWRMVF